MSIISIDEIKTLIENSSQPCVSVYMPTVKAGPEVRQNPIRFKNLIRQIEEKLDAIGIRLSDAQEWLQPVYDLDETSFWENQDNGLAIFVSPNIFRYYSLPCEFEELAIVTNHFHLKPLMPLLTNDGEFYILALSQNHVRLLQGTRFSVKEIELDVPKTLDEALQYDETAKEGQHRIATPKGGTANSFQQPGSFHGQGSPDQDEFKQIYILQFFHIVNSGVYEKLKDKKSPLVLAAVDYLLPIYQEANSYQHLLPEVISGNPELAKAEDLHTQGWQIVEPIFEQQKNEVINRYNELAVTGKASHDIREIISAAYYQRIESLVVAVGEENWGHFDPETNTVDIHSEPQPNDDDLLNFAAVYTFLNGGQVYAVPREEVPDQAPLAAIFRY